MQTIPDTPEEYRQWWSENTDVPYGFCWCECGEKTAVARWNDRTNSWVGREPKRFRPGHQHRDPALNKVTEEDRGYESPCWIWQGCIEQDGYGRRRNPNGRGKVQVHRYHYEQEYGPVPRDIELHHKCEVKSCYRPSHLEPLARKPHSRLARSVKLSVDMAEEIREMHTTGNYTHREIGEIFGVARTTVSNVINGHKWV